MAETERGLCLGDGISCLDDISQQVALAERHDALGLRGGSVGKIPADVVLTPEIVNLLLGEDGEEFDVGIMALHVGGNFEEAAHERAGTQIAEHPLLVVEESLHQTLGMGIFVSECLPAELSIVASFLDQTIPGLVQIILQ